MRTYFDCVPCAIRHTLRSARIVTDDETVHERVLRESLRGTERNAFFVRQPKCDVLARHLNCRRGRLMVVRSGNGTKQAQDPQDL